MEAHDVTYYPITYQGLVPSVHSGHHVIVQVTYEGVVMVSLDGGPLTSIAGKHSPLLVPLTRVV